MVIENSGIALYFLMAFGSGYAIGNLHGMGFLKTWLVSILFVPFAYELLNPNILMVLTVIGFSFGLYFAKSVSFFDVLSYLSPKRFLQPRKKNSTNQSTYHATFSTTVDNNASFDARRPEDVLGLPPDFTQEELKAAYQRESNRTHPDKWANKSKALQQMMSAEQQQINAAYKKLKR